MGVLSTMNTFDMDMQTLTNLLDGLSLSTASKSILNTINTMDLDFRELVGLLENFSVSTSAKSTLSTMNNNTADIQELNNLLEIFSISTSTKSTSLTTDTKDFQQLIDFLKNPSISTSPKSTFATINTTEIQIPKDLTNAETCSIATTSTSTQDSDSDSLFSTASDVTYESSVSSENPYHIDFIDSNNRSPEARNARLANLILSLDEDIPQDVDDSIKILLKNHTNTAIKFGDHYLEYKQQMATKRFTEKKLPISKSRSTRQKSPPPNNLTNSL